jgi:alkylation response protein AidB-like acyl-CoA dehydrogenase
MEFGLSSDQALLRDTLDHYLRDHAPLERVRRFATGDEGRARDLIAGLAELGVSALLIPAAHGGIGMTALDACVVAEALGYHVAPVPFVASSAMVPSALLMAGSPAQQGEWLGRLASGSVVVGAALAELSGARRDAGVKASDGRLSGRALYVLDFEADAYLVADAQGGLHLVAADAPGLTRTALPTVDTTRPIGELVFESVPADPLPGASRAVIVDQASTTSSSSYWRSTLKARTTTGRRPSRGSSKPPRRKVREASA